MMKRLIAALVLLASSANSAEPAKIPLFNGQDLTGWTPVIGQPSAKQAAAKPADIWSIAAGGILQVRGKDKPRGYLRHHRDDFANYTLTLQWRFPAGTPGGNSGVLVHTSTPGALGVWPKSLEAQLNHQNAGDIWVIGTTCEIENADKRVMGRRHYNLTDDSERPIGQWNDYKIFAKGDELTIWVNGDLVNHVTKCSVTKGAICLQAEGADIDFRHIELTPLASERQ
jgi:hypothetical protein